MAIYKAINSKTKNICIICEGFEEYDYLDRLKNLYIWHSTYNIILKNAKSLDKIAHAYQYHYTVGAYDLVLVFCDTEMTPHSQFLQLKKIINQFHGKLKVADQVVFYANPCTMQILIKHFCNAKIKDSKKSSNAKIIQAATGVIGYKATDNQRKAIMNQINGANYSVMKGRLQDCKDCTVLGSTNFVDLLNNLEQNSIKWIAKINKKLQ